MEFPNSIQQAKIETDIFMLGFFNLEDKTKKKKPVKHGRKFFL